MALYEVSLFKAIIRDLCNNDFELSSHARQRMNERNVRRYDIVHLGREYLDWSKQGENKYRISGNDLDGEKLVIVCVYDSGTLIVTVF